MIRISVFHYLFGYIHPFYDGNGRTNRFISSYLLSKELEPLISYHLAKTIKQNISKYYKSFDYTNDTDNRGDLTGFITNFLEIILASIEALSISGRQNRTFALFQSKYYYLILKIKRITEFSFTITEFFIWSGTIVCQRNG